MDKVVKNAWPNLADLKIYNKQEQIFVLNGQVVELLIINPQTKTDIKLLNKENNSIYKRLKKLYEAISQVNLNVCL